MIRDLTVLSLAQGGDAGLEHLAEAVRLGTDYPSRVAYTYALIAVGAALRRASQRAAASR